jgi:prophage regulatory protein
MAKKRNKITYTPSPLPAEGYVRLPSVLAVLGISKTSFNNGVKTGKYPSGKLISPRCRVWEVSSIRGLLTSIEQNGAA